MNSFGDTEKCQEHKMETVLRMYITLLPAIAAPALNMVWCKFHYLKFLEKPIDNHIVLKDGKRLFGANKTWKGLAGMAVLGIICATVWGAVCGKSQFLSMHNFMYSHFNNSIRYNALMGLLFGLAYSLFELPNSFIKRRMDIEPGKSKSGPAGIVNIFIDQVDSVIGCVLVLNLVYKVSISMFIGFIFLGAFTHIIINILLYLLKLRKTMM